MRKIKRNIKESILNQAIPNGKLPFWDEFMIQHAHNGELEDCYTLGHYVNFLTYMSALYNIDLKYRMISRKVSFEEYVKKHGIENYEEMKQISFNLNLFSYENEEDDFEDTIEGIGEECKDE